jgi:uncharacterized protein (TIGR03663 family)
MMLIDEESRITNQKKPASLQIEIRWETLVFALILILAVISRFYILGTRVMSHDETSHVYFSWLLEQGSGYKHDPVTHGPLQFHLLALSYFMFGDNDFTARVPAALFSVAAVAFLWFFRRDLGKNGALAAAFLFLISPYILYYGRYARNEGFIELFGVVTIWSILRYLKSGEMRYLYFFILATTLHFTAKETAFIYTAQALIFLAGYLFVQLMNKEWKLPEYRKMFLGALLITLLLFSAAVGVGMVNKAASPAETAVPTPVVPGNVANLPQNSILPMILLGLGVVATGAAIAIVIRG